MYKPLSEDSTVEAANIAIEQWRATSKNDFEKSFEMIDYVCTHISKSSHFRELVAGTAIEFLCSKEDPITDIMTQINIGVMLGFKYAMYLHEQRELKEVK